MGLSVLIILGLGLALQACSSGEEPAATPEPLPKEPEPREKPADPLRPYQVDEDAQALWKKLTQAGVPPTWIDRGKHLLSYPMQSNPGQDPILGKGDYEIGLQEVYASVHDLANPSTSISKMAIAQAIPGHAETFAKLESGILSEREGRLAYGLALLNHPDQAKGALERGRDYFQEEVNRHGSRSEQSAAFWKVGLSNYKLGNYKPALILFLWVRHFDMESLAEHEEAPASTVEAWYQTREAMEQLLNTMGENHELREAIKELKISLGHYPGDPIVLYSLGRAQQLMGYQHKEEVKGSYEKALRFVPKGSQNLEKNRIRIALADFLYDEGEYRQARKHYRWVIETESQDVDAFFRGLSERVDKFGDDRILAEALVLRTHAHMLERDVITKYGLDE